MVPEFFMNKKLFTITNWPLIVYNKPYLLMYKLTFWDLKIIWKNGSQPIQ